MLRTPFGSFCFERKSPGHVVFTSDDFCYRGQEITFSAHFIFYPSTKKWELHKLNTGATDWDTLRVNWKSTGEGVPFSTRAKITAAVIAAWNAHLTF